jgi:hypothetical protein
MAKEILTVHGCVPDLKISELTVHASQDLHNQVVRLSAVGRLAEDWVLQGCIDNGCPVTYQYQLSCTPLDTQLTCFLFSVLKQFSEKQKDPEIFNWFKKYANLIKKSL